MSRRKQQSSQSVQRLFGKREGIGKGGAVCPGRGIWLFCDTRGFKQFAELGVKLAGLGGNGLGSAVRLREQAVVAAVRKADAGA